MNGGPSVVVNKGGFLAALAKGFFGLLTVVVICATGLGLYGVRTVDRHLSNLTHGVPAVLEVARGWQEALPPALKDALNDRRAFEYRTQLDVQARLRPDERGRHGDRDERGLVVIDVTNRGEEVVSLLALDLYIDGAAPYAYDTTVYAATPIAVEDEWRGPLLPGQTRHLVASVWNVDDEADVQVDVVDLRIWAGPAPENPTDGRPAESSPVEDRPADDAIAGNEVPVATAESE